MEFAGNEIRRGMVTLAPDLEIEVVVLDTGTRIITEESFNRFWVWLEGASHAATVEAVARFTDATNEQV